MSLTLVNAIFAWREAMGMVTFCAEIHSNKAKEKKEPNPATTANGLGCHADCQAAVAPPPGIAGL